MTSSRDIAATEKAVFSLKMNIIERIRRQKRAKLSMRFKIVKKKQIYDFLKV